MVSRTCGRHAAVVGERIASSAVTLVGERIVRAVHGTCDTVAIQLEVTSRTNAANALVVAVADLAHAVSGGLAVLLIDSTREDAGASDDDCAVVALRADSRPDLLIPGNTDADSVAQFAVGRTTVGKNAPGVGRVQHVAGVADAHDSVEVAVVKAVVVGHAAVAHFGEAGVAHADSVLEVAVRVAHHVGHAAVVGVARVPVDADALPVDVVLEVAAVGAGICGSCRRNETDAHTEPSREVHLVSDTARAAVS